MATTPQTVPAAPDAPQDLQALAKRHLWMHFTRMGAYEDADVPVIARGEGCYVWDTQGNRYLDGLSALFCVNVGHGRAEIGEAMAAQAAELGFFTNWSYAHPRAIELAARIASYAPGDLNRVFFTSGGSEAVESALKLVRNYHRIRGDGQRHKVIAREIAYHGTSLGALSATGIPALRTPFEPLTPGGCHVPNTNEYHWPEGRDPLWAADAIEERIEFEGPETVAAVILEPVQNAGGCFTPQEGYFQRVREICDRHGVLLISDEVICSWGRLGHWFGCERYDYRPDIVTTAKGLTSAYAPMGARDRLRRDRRAVHARQDDVRPRLHVRRPSRSPPPRRTRTSTSSSARTSTSTCARRSPSSARCSRACATCRSSATCAAPGSSRRSSSSRTRRRARASTTRSPSGCCAASSPASSSSRA